MQSPAPRDANLDGICFARDAKSDRINVSRDPQDAEMDGTDKSRFREFWWRGETRRALNFDFMSVVVLMIGSGNCIRNHVMSIAGENVFDLYRHYIVYYINMCQTYRFPPPDTRMRCFMSIYSSNIDPTKKAAVMAATDSMCVSHICMLWTIEADIKRPHPSRGSSRAFIQTMRSTRAFSEVLRSGVCKSMSFYLLRSALIFLVGEGRYVTFTS